MFIKLLVMCALGEQKEFLAFVHKCAGGDVLMLLTKFPSDS